MKLSHRTRLTIGAFVAVAVVSAALLRLGLRELGIDLPESVIGAAAGCGAVAGILHVLYRARREGAIAADDDPDKGGGAG